jgi:hypothetical protein
MKMFIVCFLVCRCGYKLVIAGAVGRSISDGSPKFRITTLNSGMVGDCRNSHWIKKFSPFLLHSSSVGGLLYAQTILQELPRQMRVSLVSSHTDSIICLRKKQDLFEARRSRATGDSSCAGQYFMRYASCVCWRSGLERDLKSMIVPLYSVVCKHHFLLASSKRRARILCCACALR